MQLEVFTDGGSRGNPGDAGIGGVIYGANKSLLFEFSAYIGETTNNVAEYKALLHALEWLSTYEEAETLDSVVCYLDSKLVVEQMNQNWKIKDSKMKELAQKCWSIVNSLRCEPSFVHVRREKNKEADALVNQALDAHQL
jgi:ribonuclease HI